MAFTDEQRKALEAKLHPENVKTRVAGGNSKLAYVEGWHVIAEANRIFGYDGWSRETLELRCVHEGKTDRGKPRAAYVAKVRITVYAGDRIITREGSGWGQGFGEGGEDHEKAVKEAETDATKRALATFGWPFGLALYDKDRENVGVDEDGPARPPPQQQRREGAAQPPKHQQQRPAEQSRRQISETPEDRRGVTEESIQEGADDVLDDIRTGRPPSRRPTDRAPKPGAARGEALARGAKAAKVPAPKPGPNDNPDLAWSDWTDALEQAVLSQPSREAAEAFARSHVAELKACADVLRTDMFKWIAGVVNRKWPKDLSR